MNSCLLFKGVSKCLLSVFLMIAWSWFLMGQNMTDIAKFSEVPLETKDSLKSGWFERVGIGIGGGTKGLIATDVALAVKGNWNIRFGYNWFKVIVDQFESDFEGALDTKIWIDADLRLSSLEFLTEYGLLKGGVRLVGGVSYALDNSLELSAGLAENLELNDVSLSPEEVGDIGGRIFYTSRWSSYLGIGFGRSIPKKRVSLNLDLGLYVRGIPQIDIVATGIFKSNEENEDILNAALRSDSFYRIWPVGQLRIAVTLFKPDQGKND